MHVPGAANLGNVRGGDQGDHDTDGQDEWWQGFCKLWAQHWQMEPVLVQAAWMYAFNVDIPRSAPSTLRTSQ
jgi:hypothetical protein